MLPSTVAAWNLLVAKKTAMGSPFVHAGRRMSAGQLLDPVRAPHMYKNVGVIVGRRVKSHMYENGRGNCVEEGSF